MLSCKAAAAKLLFGFQTTFCPIGMLYLKLACLAASAAAASLLLDVEGAAHYHHIKCVQCLQKQDDTTKALRHVKL